MKNVEINYTPGDSTPVHTLEIREGKALDLMPDNVVGISGDIGTVDAFLTTRQPAVPGINRQAIDKDRAVIYFNKEQRTISLDVNPQCPYGTKVTGTLDISDELKPFGINTQRTFNREELVKLLRFNKRFFPDPMKHDEMYRAFQSLNLTGSTALKAESDTRGNKDVAFKKQINSENIPTKFVLQMPIFKGLPSAKFEVEVCLESTESSVIFWFESVELKQLQDITAEEIFNDFEKKYNGTFLIVNK